MRQTFPHNQKKKKKRAEQQSRCEEGAGANDLTVWHLPPSKPMGHTDISVSGKLAALSSGSQVSHPTCTSPTLLLTQLTRVCTYCVLGTHWPGRAQAPGTTGSTHVLDATAALQGPAVPWRQTQRRNKRSNLGCVTKQGQTLKEGGGWGGKTLDGEPAGLPEGANKTRLRRTEIV